MMTLCLGLSLSLTGCGLFGGKPELEPTEQKKPSQPRYIGQITSIHAAQGFVLIRRSPGVTLVPSTILISRGPGGPKQQRVANLRITGESLGQMAAADIQSGSPQVGDSVYEALPENSELESESVTVPEETPEVTPEVTPEGAPEDAPEGAPEGEKP